MAPRSADPYAATRPFDALDRDWAALCRRHRRIGTVQAWAKREPALATKTRLEDLLLAPGNDRTVVFEAVGRLATAGDRIAQRALLQLLIPGLVKLAGRWTSRYGGMDNAGWEVITRAGDYIARLNSLHVRCSLAGYLLRSIERDLGAQAKADDRRQAALQAVAAEDGTAPSPRVLHAPSAEAVAFALPLQRHFLDRVAADGILSPAGVDLLWLHVAHDHTVPAAARELGLPVATAYRTRDRARRDLHDLLAA